MAKGRTKIGNSTLKKNVGLNSHRITSIGNSLNTKPKNKNKRRNYKPYRGQG